MKQLSDYAVCLLVDEDKKVVFPFSFHGFELTDRWITTALEDNRHCWFLFSDGSTKRVTEVALIDSPLVSRLRLIFRLPIRIKTTLKALDVPMARMKALILDGLKKDHELTSQLDGETWQLLLVSFPEIQTAIENAANSSELYRKLELPPPTECLDLL